MNTILLYFNLHLKSSIKDILSVINAIQKFNKDIFIHDAFFQNIDKEDLINIERSKLFSYRQLDEIKRPIHLLIVIGGDGTLLEAVHLVKNKNIPILGINTGRLGFLANLNFNDIDNALQYIFRGKYSIDKRTMLKLETENNKTDFDYALNEFTIHKMYSSSMITIDLLINGIHVNTYWADGIIIATPTGSTAYSLSAGGPIIHPDSKSFVITPIAVHNLNVRPLIVPDSCIITLKVTGRSDHCMISLDHKSTSVPINATFTISKADIETNLLHCPEYNFFNTLKNKLMWGLDKRN
ncbi:MAG: NAD kinase [Bacteroidales bacterium]|nr:NAD kinase [Bacteroidales bacterium]